jgi:hypothetical protein
MQLITDIYNIYDLTLRVSSDNKFVKRSLPQISVARLSICHSSFVCFTKYTLMI